MNTPIDIEINRLIEELEEHGVTEGMKAVTRGVIKGLIQAEKDRQLQSFHKQQTTIKSHNTINRAYIEEKTQEAINISHNKSYPISHTRMYFEELIREITSAGIEEGMRIQRQITEEARRESEQYNINNPRL